MFSYITGVVLRDKFQSFERIMFRATRGNLYLRYAEVKKPLKDNDGRDVAKNVFIIFFQVTIQSLRMNTTHKHHLI
jgi:V-type H+-transporting ATPase subunit a